MAGKKLNIAGKVTASSILETVVAMVIIVVVFSTAMVILGNVMKNSISVMQIRAKSLLRTQMQQEENRPYHENSDRQADDLYIQQKITGIPEQRGVVMVELTASDGHGKKIAELRKIISGDEN
jgi:Tfp pilus assembly protein PilV